MKPFRKTFFILLSFLSSFLVLTEASAFSGIQASSLTNPGSTSGKQFEAGKDYKVLETPIATRDSSKIEVIEFFWYGCPHCYAFEPDLEAWIKKQPKDVDFWRSPVVWGAVKKIHAQAYYTSEILGVLNKTHKPFFEAVHTAAQKAKSEKVYDTQEEIADFFVSQGVDRKAFDEAFVSFAVSSKLQQADARGRSYMIQGVPTLIVNGKYMVVGSMPNSLEVVDYLIQKEKNNLPKK